MIEGSYQGRGNSEIADAGVWIDVGRGAALDPLRHLQPRLADRDLLAEQAELMPCRPALDIEVGAEAQRMHRHANHVLDRRDGRQIDDRHDLGGDIRKAVTFGLEHLRRAAQFRRHEAAEERLDRETALFGREIAARELATLAADDERVGLVLVAGGERREALVTHQHQELRFWQICGCRRIEAARAVLDRVHPVGGQRPAGLKADARRGSRGSAPSPDSGRSTRWRPSPWC